MCILDRMSAYKDLQTHSSTNGYVTYKDNDDLYNESVQITCTVK